MDLPGLNGSESTSDSPCCAQLLRSEECRHPSEQPAPCEGLVPLKLGVGFAGAAGDGIGFGAFTTDFVSEVLCGQLSPSSTCMYHLLLN